MAHKISLLLHRMSHKRNNRSSILMLLAKTHTRLVHVVLMKM